jgi:hypothetical protein
MARSPGVAAGLSTLLAVAAGAVTNVATSEWTAPVAAGLVVLVGTYVAFEAWRAGSDRHGTGEPGAGPRRPWMAPPLDRMVERPQLAGPLLTALAARGSTTERLQVVGLHGAGGFGKTSWRPGRVTGRRSMAAIREAWCG